MTSALLSKRRNKKVHTIFLTHAGGERAIIIYIVSRFFRDKNYRRIKIMEKRKTFWFRIVAIVLTFSMLFALSACGGKVNADTDPNSIKSQD